MEIGQADAVRPQQTQAELSRLPHQLRLAGLAVRPGLAEAIGINRHDLGPGLGAGRQQGGHVVARDHDEYVVHRPGQPGKRGIGALSQDLRAGGVDGIDGAGVAVLAHEAQRTRGVLARVARGAHQGDGTGGQQCVGKRGGRHG
ncbi:hypothetical protein D3C87_1397160 [compost metagenome]